ncbi:MAG: UDP-2,3-diacylglucosamine diphosphatase [Methanobacterium sp. ERen5]|nr:MAG: UDP-2,3-diacylglucosamine diphosphatase [Methanobacterium sp. ERen5]
MMLVISDLHLGYEKSNTNAFYNFLDDYNSKVDHLILLGDFFDFWRKNNSEIVLEYEKILDKLLDLKANKIHYIIGNHDYHMLKLKERYGDNFPFEVKKNLRLEDNGKKFYFTHGYEFEAAGLEPFTIDMYEDFSEKMCFSEDVIGGVAGQIWDIIQGSDIKERLERDPRKRFETTEESLKIYKMANSTGKCYLFGMKPNERLVFGHTHGPFINHNKTVVNSGSWTGELKNKDYQNSYVEINDGNMELKFYRE